METEHIVVYILLFGCKLQAMKLLLGDVFLVRDGESNLGADL